MAGKPPIGLHENLSREQAVKMGSERSFGLVFTAVFLIIGCWPLIGAEAPRWWALGVAGLFLLLALLKPDLLAPLNRAWLRFGLLLHRIVSPLVLGLMFALVFVPIGLLLRLFGKDPLRLRLDPAAQSYWIEREPPGPAADSMTNQF